MAEQERAGFRDRMTARAEQLRERNEARMKRQRYALEANRDFKRAGMLLNAVLIGFLGVAALVAGIAMLSGAFAVAGALILYSASELFRVWKWLPLFIPDPETADARRRASRHILRAAGAFIAACLLLAVFFR